MGRLIECVSTVLVSLSHQLHLSQKQTSWRKLIHFWSWVKANLFGFFLTAFGSVRVVARKAFFLSMKVTKEMHPSEVPLVQVSTCDWSGKLLLFSFIFGYHRQIQEGLSMKKKHIISFWDPWAVQVWNIVLELFLAGSQGRGGIEPWSGLLWKTSVLFLLTSQNKCSFLAPSDALSEQAGILMYKVAAFWR